jgi:TRAP-type C4-dicarboxylate transport system permease small subunit
MHLFQKIITNAIKSILMILMVMMVITVSYGVFTRFILNSSASWTGELAGYILVWITFFGSAWAIFDKSHISFDSLVEKLPRVVGSSIKFLFNLAMIFFVSVMTYYGFIVTKSSIYDATLTLPLSRGIVFAVVPVSGLIMIIGFMVEIVLLFRKQNHRGHTG